MLTIRPASRRRERENMRRRTKIVVLGAAITLVTVAALLMALARSGTPSAAGASRSEGNMPPALARHIEQVQRAIPGNGGEPSEGPGAADAVKLDQLAYPATDIPLAWLNAERSAVSSVKARDFPGGKSRVGPWISVGPKNALYPLSPL